MIAELSEKEGAFFADTPLSNEDGYGAAIPWLERSAGREPSVYLGVGPEQNLTFIARAKPELAFVVDLRRANLLLHVLYKSMFADSTTPSQWLLLCLGRRPAPLVDEPSPEAWLVAIRAVAKDRTVHEALLERTLARMTGTWGMALEPGDAAALSRLLATFFERDLQLRYETTDHNDEFPSFSELLLAKDEQGHALHFLADPGAFAALKKFEAEDRLLPIVGNFAGEHALGAIGDTLRRLNRKLGVLYASNVEEYLLIDEQWGQWQSNVARLPRTSDALLLRSAMSHDGRAGSGARAHWSLQVTPLEQLVQRAAAPRSYRDLFEGSTAP
jgi:hypothetical protein